MMLQFNRRLRIAPERSQHRWALKPDATRLATAGYNSPIEVWDVATGQRISSFETQAKRIDGLAYSPKDETLAVYTFSGPLQFWDAATGKHLGTIRNPATGVGAMAFSADGKIFAFSENDFINLWDVEGKKSTAGLHGGWAAIAFSPDGRLVAAAGIGTDTDPLDKVVRVWELATRKLRATIKVGILTTSLTFAPDCKTLAVGQGHFGKPDVNRPIRFPNDILLVDTVEGKEIARLSGHSDGSGQFGHPHVVTVFDSSGKYLISGALDRTIRLWDLATKKTVAKVDSGAPVVAIALSSDGKTVAAACKDGTITLCDFKPER